MLLKLGDQLRDAMSYWPSGVAILAVSYRGRLEAITVNSFISVSLQPPLILISIAQQASIRPALDDAARFTISILGGSQGVVASKVADRFPGLASMFDDVDGEPVVTDCVAALVCTIAETHTAGDHVLYLGAVERVVHGRDDGPLIYQRRKYRKIL